MDNAQNNHMESRPTDQADLLRSLLASQRPLVMPDAYDALSARLIEMAGFNAIQCSGFSMALAARCSAETQMTLATNLDVTGSIVQAVRIPVMADGEDGYGAPEHVYTTVQAFCKVGVAGINLEDQMLPSPARKQVVELSLMIEKIRAAREAAAECQLPNLLINGRTDALVAHEDRARGLQEAIERGNHYLHAGADLIFVVGVATIAEAKRLVDEIPGPVSIAAGMPYNLRNMSIRALRDCGVARVSLPSVAIFSALKAVKRTLALIRDTEDFAEVIEQDLVGNTQDVADVLKK